MDKVIIYGLGRNFEANRKVFEDGRDVIGYSDRDKEKVQTIPGGINIEDICKYDFDYILVTTSNKNIKNELANDIGVGKDKIRFGWNYIEDNNKLESYSEVSEDIIVDRVFFNRKGDYRGVHYVDLGILSPTNGDNTYFFYLRGARGILVEADSSLINRIEEERSEDIVLNRAVCEMDDQEVIFYKCIEDAGLSSLDAKHIEHWENENFSSKPIKIKSVTINTIMELLGQHCDILSIDIEGYDYKVLKMLDFDKYKPTVIIVEMLDRVWCRNENDNIYNLLIDNGYKFYAKTRSNGIFVDKDYKF